jgi:hypothetical protein
MPFISTTPVTDAVHADCEFAALRTASAIRYPRRPAGATDDAAGFI